MKLRRLNNINNYLSAIWQMIQLIWQSQPAAIIGLILLQIVQGLIPVLSAWLTKQLFDLLEQVMSRTLSGKFIQILLPTLVALTVIEILMQLFPSFNTFLNSDLSRKLKLNTEAIIYKQIAKLDGLAYFENPQFYDTIRLATQGIGSAPPQLINIATELIRSVVILVSFLGILLFISPLLAIIIGTASLPHLIVQLNVSRQHLGLAFQNSPKERKAFYLGQVLSGIHFVKEVRLFNLVEYFLDQFLQTTREVQNAQRIQQLRELRWQLGLGVLSSFVNGGAFIVIVLEAFNRQISLGDVTLYTSALGNIQGALIGIVFAFSNLNESVLFFNHFTKLMKLPPAISLANPTRPVPSLKSGIELRDVSFRYSEQHPWVLQNINLFIPKGKCVAFVGLNGTGKTTIVKLLTRLYDPCNGHILWDGVDIREFDPIELRQQMGAIFQDFVHYDLTVQENIGLGCVSDINNERRVHHAAQKVGIHERLEKLSLGYQTVLSRWLTDNERGADLSGGEWQKIALARMSMRDANVLLLDEPTAALDAQAEYNVYKNFVKLIAGKTCLLISHRFGTVRMADIIAVLENGKISEYGSHERLLSLGGTYAKLYVVQANIYK